MSLLWGYVGFDVPGNCLGKSVSYSVMSDSVTPWTVAYQAPLWNSPGKNTGMSCHSLLQGIFLTQRLNPGLLHCRQILYQRSHQESPSCSVRSANKSSRESQINSSPLKCLFLLWMFLQSSDIFKYIHLFGVFGVM